MIYYCNNHRQTQIFICGDIQQEGGVYFLSAIQDKKIPIVYSDPPWNPGNAKWWRRHAGLDTTCDYQNFMVRWVDLVMACRGLKHIFCEQSYNEKHQQFLFNAISQYDQTFPLLEQWRVFYGSPGGKSCVRPNTLLHFGQDRLKSNPEGMRGEGMTRTVFDGLCIGASDWIVDLCIGKGMTSRMAHYYGGNCIGVELNDKRINYAISWLRKQGYDISAKNGMDASCENL